MGESLYGTGVSSVGSGIGALVLDLTLIGSTTLGQNQLLYLGWFKDLMAKFKQILPLLCSRQDCHSITVANIIISHENVKG